MFKSTVWFCLVCISVLLAQSDIDERLAKKKFVEEFGQCGGLNYKGPRKCRPNLICFKRSRYYSQCLSSKSAANVTQPIPQIISINGKCYGENIDGPVLCSTGSAWFIQTENVHGECRSTCPEDWFCAQQTLPEWSPCGGHGYIGLTKCQEGLECYAHSKWYHECRNECPEGWEC